MTLFISVSGKQLFLQDYLGDFGEGGGTKEGEFSRELSRLLDLPGTSPDGVVSHYLSRKILKEKNKNRIPLSSIVSINFEVSSGVYKTIEVSEVKSFFLAIEISDEHYMSLFNQLRGVVSRDKELFSTGQIKGITVRIHTR